MKRIKIAFLGIFALLSCVSCGGGGGGTITYLTLGTPLGFSAMLDGVADGLGAGDFGTPVKFNMQSSSGVMGMVDAFFAFLNAAEIPEGSTQVAVTTDQGELKADFRTLGTVIVDLGGDGTEETIACSRSTTLPICARFWIDDVPLALLVLNAQTTDAYIGQGLLTFVPSLVGLSESVTDASVTWSGNAARDLATAFYAGLPATGIVASKAAMTFRADRLADDSTMINMDQSGEWTQNPISGCTQSQAIFGWIEDAAFIGARFNPTGSCTLPTGGPCVDIATATAVDDSNCTVDISTKTYISLGSFDEQDAQLPADFPQTPPF